MSDEENEDKNWLERLPWWLNIAIGLLGFFVLFNLKLPLAITVVVIIPAFSLFWVMVLAGLWQLAERVPHEVSSIIKVIAILWIVVPVGWVAMKFFEGALRGTGDYYNDADENPLVPNRYE